MNETFDSIDAFNFDAMTQAVGQDPFAAQANKYNEDTRFYKLKKDKDGNGAALIRFLPDIEKGRIVELFKINTTISKNGKKRFVSEFTPATIGQPCPFQEEWARLYNAGDTDGAKMFGRSKKFISNIKVLKDPNNPENEGKIFLYEYSGAIKAKIENANKPSETDIALGKTPKEMFNPLKGHSFRLVAQKGSNGQINYDASEVVGEETSIYGSVEEAVADIRENTYKLSDFFKPESYMTYEQLKDKFAWVTWANESAAPAATPVPEAVVEVAPAATTTPEVTPAAQPTAAVTAEVTPTPTPSGSTDELDSLLKGLV